MWERDQQAFCTPVLASESNFGEILSETDPVTTADTGGRSQPLRDVEGYHNARAASTLRLPASTFPTSSMEGYHSAIAASTLQWPAFLGGNSVFIVNNEQKVLDLESYLRNQPSGGMGRVTIDKV